MITWSPVPAIPTEVVSQMKALKDSGASQAELIVRMRAAGLHIMDCMKLIVQFYGVTRTEAKIIVHGSEAWADVRAQHDAFHETVWEAAKLAGFEEVPVDSLKAAS